MSNWILTGYIDAAMSRAGCDKLEDGTFSGRIPGCKGIVAFGRTLRECRDELRSVLEDWIFVGLKTGHELPVIDSYDLNKEPDYERMASL